MIQCQCPKCQSSFQVAEQSVGFPLPCPECRFQVEVPKLEADAPASAQTLIAECPRCRMKFPVPFDQAGTTRPCPACQARVRVPALPWEQREQQWRECMMILAVFGLILFMGAYAVGWLNPILEYFNPNPNSAFFTAVKRMKEGTVTVT
jgi:hypothetical protein